MTAIVRVYNTTSCADGACVRTSVKVQTAARQWWRRREKVASARSGVQARKNIINRLMTCVCVFIIIIFIIIVIVPISLVPDDDITLL